MAKAKRPIDSAPKTPRKPRAKKEPKLPEPMTAEELATSYASLPAAELEPVETQPSEQTEIRSSAQIPEGTKGETNEGTETTAESWNGSTTTAQTETDSQKNGTGEDGGTTTQPDKNQDGEAAGDVSPAGDEGDSLSGGTQDVMMDLARARDGETKSQCWERLRREGRASGMTRKGAIAYASGAIDRLFPPKSPEPEPPPEPVIEVPEPEPEVSTTVDIEPEPIAAPPIVDSGVSGLGDLPAGWGDLPANASLQVEIAWVSANRLRVRSGNGVDLSRALSPAPSYSALSWLETSILFPSKFADISVKATASQDDEKEFIRREKFAIEEIRSILKEMLEG